MIIFLTDVNLIPKSPFRRIDESSELRFDTIKIDPISFSSFRRP